MLKVLVKGEVFEDLVYKKLEKKCELIMVQDKIISNQEIGKKILDHGGIDVLVWCGHQTLDREFFNQIGKGRLKLISSVSVGVDHYDLKTLKEFDIKLTNTPDVLCSSVANIAIGLAISAGRRFEEGRQSILNNQWIGSFRWMLGYDFDNSTIGIVGFGKIGQTIAKRLKGFDVKDILYTSRKKKVEGDQLGAKYTNLENLLKSSDFVFVCVALTEETKHSFGKVQFEMMKPNAIFVNIARGGIVVQDDLVEALRSKQIFAAGLDVMTPEPIPTDHPLTKLPNCVLIPHLGSATISTRRAMQELALKNVEAYIEGKPLLTQIIF